MKNVVVVVDTNNIMQCLSRAFKVSKLNYGEYLRRAVDSEREILFKGIAYISQPEENCKPFVGALSHLGFDSKFKPPTVRGKDAESQYLKHVSMDVAITVDVMELIETGKVDRLVLGSSSDSLADLLNYARKRNVFTTVFANGITRMLQESADEVVEIDKDLLYSGKKD